MGDDGQLQGVVTIRNIETAASPANTVSDLMGTDGKYPYVHADHPLSYALERMGSGGVDVLPVVSRANIREMQGVVSLADILTKYGVRRQGDV